MKRFLYLAAVAVLGLASYAGLVSPAHPPLDRADIQQQFDAYNDVYFAGKLPPTVVNFVTFTDVREGYDKYGQALCNAANTACTIELASWMRGHYSVAKEVELHEMCHIAVWRLVQQRGEDDHGPTWMKEMHRLMDAGAFDDVL